MTSILGLAFLLSCFHRYEVFADRYHLRYVGSSSRQLQTTNDTSASVTLDLDVAQPTNDTSITLDLDVVSASTHDKDSNENIIGSMYTKIVFDGVSSSNYAESELLTNYINYGVTRVMDDNLDSDIELIDIVFQPLETAPELTLSYPMMISLRYPSDRNDVFVHADGILSSKIENIPLYLNEYVETIAISKSDKLELVSMLKDIFVGVVETEEDDPPPTQAPTKKKFIKPVNTWINTAADTTAESLETMPYWGWIIVGCGLGFMVICCCCCVLLHFLRRRSDADRKETSSAVADTTKAGESKRVSWTGSQECKPDTPDEDNNYDMPPKEVPEPIYSADDQDEVIPEPRKKSKMKAHDEEKSHMHMPNELNHDESNDKQEMSAQPEKQQLSGKQSNEQETCLDPEEIIPEFVEVLPVLYPNPEPQKKKRTKKKKKKTKKGEETQIDEDEMSFGEWLEHATKKSTKKDKKKALETIDDLDMAQEDHN